MKTRTNRMRLAAVGLAALVAATLAPAAWAQIIVDGQETVTVIQGRPVQRTYAQVYPPQNRARLVTRQSVLAAGGSIPPVESARYVQYGPQPLTPPPGSYTSPPPTITVEEFRIDPWSQRRYRNTYYPRYSYQLGGRSWYSPWYWGYYGWSFRPSLYRFNYCTPSYRSCGSSSWYGGSFLRYSSSCGLSLRIRF